MMKKILIVILFIFMFICTSCEVPTDSKTDGTKPNESNSELIELIDKYLGYQSIYVEDVTYVNHVSAVEGYSYYEFKEDFKGHSNVNVIDSSLSKNSSSIIYHYNDSACVSSGKNAFYTSYIPTDIYEYLGLDNILKDAKNNKSYTGELAGYKATGVASNIIYELGLEKTAAELISNNKIKYEISQSNTTKLEINLVITDFYKSISPNASIVEKTLIISEYQDYSFPEFPTDSGTTEQPETDKDKLAQIEGKKYIESRFENLKYLRNDFDLYPQCPTNIKVKYSYRISDTSILDLNGNFNHPTEETPFKITIDLSYNGLIYDTVEYEIIALPEGNYTGITGSLTNPLNKSKKTTDTLDVYFIEMIKQYGDSIYIKSGDFDMLIDAGTNDDAGNVRKILKEYVYDQTLECLIATHAHSDHIGGMTTVLNAIKNIDYVVDFGYDRADYATTDYYRRYINNKADEVHPIYNIVNNVGGLSSTIYISDDFYIKFLDTNQYIKPGVDIDGGNDNAASVTFIMTFKGKKFYFSGDLETNGENNLVSSGQLEDVDVMKATHHGTSGGNTTALLNKIKPELVVVSAAMETPGSASQNAKDQVHPSRQALSRFYSAGAKVYSNSTNGTIKVSTDGNTITLIGFGRSKPYYYGGKAITGEENLEFKYTKWAQVYR